MSMTELCSKCWLVNISDQNNLSLWMRVISIASRSDSLMPGLYVETMHNTVTFLFKESSKFGSTICFWITTALFQHTVILYCLQFLLMVFIIYRCWIMHIVVKKKTNCRLDSKIRRSVHLMHQSFNSNQKHPNWENAVKSVYSKDWDSGVGLDLGQRGITFYLV